MRGFRSLWALALTVVLVNGAAASEGKDHPLISRFPGTEIQEYKQATFDELLLPLGQIIDRDEYVKAKKVEGKVTKIKYNTPEDRASLEIFRSYQSALEKAGFKTLFTCAGKECISDKFNHGYSNCVTGTWGDFGEPMRYLTAQKSRPEGDIYVTLLVLKEHYEGGTWLNVVEEKPMQEGLVTVKSAEAMKTDIGSAGHTPVYGVYFDTGKAVIKPESDPTLQQIVKLLKVNPDMKLHVVGHTDNVGTMAANMALSKQRAAAVVAALTSGKYGVAPLRLDAAGVGPLSPVTTNRTEEGRAKNRRVELVEQ